MLKILNDRVIIDGHEPTREQCETMTLLANALNDSTNFKRIEYKSGYAEFEKVGKTSELKFIPAPADTLIIFDSNITKVEGAGCTWSTSGETQTTMTNDGDNYVFVVTLNTGYVLNTVTLSDSNETYGKLVGQTDNSFTILAGASGLMQTITLTSKLEGVVL